MSDMKTYNEYMFGNGRPHNREDREHMKNALDRAHDIRKFEIRLYWTRSLYFWGFEATIFAGIIALWEEGKYDFLLLVLSIFGLFTTFAWYYVSKGSKAWQENWENHIDLLETPYEGDLYRVILGEKENFYSVSKINKHFIFVVGILWFVLLAYVSTRSDMMIVMVGVVCFFILPYFWKSKDVGKGKGKCRKRDTIFEKSGR